ncbi:MAG TPA: FAD-binding oxidoreductase, partial [Propionibacteriaceae bacterium]
MTTTSKTPSLAQLRPDDLAGVRGAIITPSDPRYDAARAVHNGAVDRYPLAIVQCADVADVMACVAYARENVLPLAIRGGGHHGGGFGVWDDALVIDLSRLRSTSVDPEAGTVRVDGGCVWGDVDHATGAFGMALPSGFMSTTGVGGLTLGGGVGYLTRRFGLTLDNLISADVVLADGRFVTASADSHSDLFWALRGGGGNFGVVTSFTFRCHPIGEHGVIIGGPILYDIADVEDLFGWYRDLLP